MSNAKILIGYANMNAAIWWCKWKLLVMQVPFMRMQMQMYVLVMYGFAAAWACRRSQRMMQTKISCFANIFQEDAYANVMHAMQMFEPILMDVQKFIAAFLFKNRLSYLILNLSDHYQEFFRVRSIWCFEKFSSTSLDLFPKISQFDWKWDVWKLFLGLAHEFSTIEHHEKIFILVNFKQIQFSF